MTALYERVPGGFEPSEFARGPWSADAQHAGPPAALLAGALEAAAADHFQLVRMSVEILRPVPMSLLYIEGDVLRGGKRLCVTEARLEAEGTPIARATGVHHRVTRLEVPEQPSAVHSLPDQPDGLLPIPNLADDDVTWFGHAVRARYEAPGDGPGPGPHVIWLKLAIDLVAGEATSPWQWTVPLTDCTNGVSWWDLGGVAFPNSDLTVALHRLPADRWIRLDAHSSWGSTGTGLADAHLSDRHGSIGRALQSLFLS